LNGHDTIGGGVLAAQTGKVFKSSSRQTFKVLKLKVFISIVDSTKKPGSSPGDGPG